jgi:hypothetical protein
MTTREWALAAPRPAPHRTVLASVLRAASALLARWARLLHRRVPAGAAEPILEFYAEAGAPEGALYVDGKLVARLPGVTRL